ncbi:MAG: helix-turn-helix domain-containing protein [Dehalococcoidia bacterium]|nr:helix-turn-helix domain-containing protein [Dehalococcoidia bacterium]
MDEFNLPNVLTPDEIASYLKVDVKMVLKEMEIGNLRGFKIGLEWRSTDTDILQYINSMQDSIMRSKSPSGRQINREDRTDFVEIGAFDYQWPKSKEHFEKGYEATKLIGSRSYTFKIGFTDREAAGRMRRRIVVWRDNWPLVEFAGGDTYESDGLLASIVKLKNGKQLRPSEKIPEEYNGFRTARYNSIIQGPYASRNMAIVVASDDLESMLRHAIIRGRQKNLI